MGAVFAFFLFASIYNSDSEWLTLADLQGADVAVQDSLYYVSWLLAVPLLALAMGLIGQILYPPVLPEPAVPPLEQLAAPKARKTDLRLYWRIVRRASPSNPPTQPIGTGSDCDEISEHENDWWHPRRSLGDARYAS